MENSLIVVLTFKTQVFKGLTAHLLFSSSECSSLVGSWLVQYTVVFIEPIDIIHALLRNIATRFKPVIFSSNESTWALEQSGLEFLVEMFNTSGSGIFATPFSECPEASISRKSPK